MSYVIMDKTKDLPIKVDRFVSGIDIITVYEPVGSIQFAETFEKKENAELILDALENKGHNRADFQIIDKEEFVIKEEQKAFEETAESWKSLSPEDKQKFIELGKKALGEEAVDEFLKNFGN